MFRVRFLCMILVGRFSIACIVSVTVSLFYRVVGFVFR